MKLIPIIAAASLMMTANPVEAASKWIRAHESVAYVGYVKDIHMQGDIIELKMKFWKKRNKTYSKTFTSQFNCSEWTERQLKGTQWAPWQDIMPATMGDGILNQLCN